MWEDTLYLQLHKLSAVSSEETLDEIFTNLWKTRKTGLRSPEKFHFQSLLNLPSLPELDPVMFFSLLISLSLSSLPRLIFYFRFFSYGYLLKKKRLEHLLIFAALDKWSLFPRSFIYLFLARLCFWGLLYFLVNLELIRLCWSVLVYNYAVSLQIVYGELLEWIGDTEN